MNSIVMQNGCATLMAGALLAALATSAVAQSTAPVLASVSAVAAAEANFSGLETIVVTARLRQEDAQTVPISLSVVDSETIERTRSANIAQISQLVPSLNYTSPNLRNTAYTIRGLGSSVVAIAQANDGLEPGVGFYVDQVFHGRPATAAFDFVDLDLGLQANVQARISGCFRSPFHMDCARSGVDLEGCCKQAQQKSRFGEILPLCGGAQRCLRRVWDPTLNERICCHGADRVTTAAEWLSYQGKITQYLTTSLASSLRSRRIATETSMCAELQTRGNATSNNVQ